ncbi:MAG: signal peptidase I [Patescibacteria group bacterium]
MENKTEKSDTHMPQEKKSNFSKHMASAWDLVKFAAIALAIVIPIRTFVAQPFVVNGESMFPTFDNGQYLIVDELSYIIGEPERGDVVIFRYPKDPSRYFIKRVIGLPNEEVSISGGTVTVFNKDSEKGFILSEPYLNENFRTEGTYTTGNDEYFVMGDNRNASSDSRLWGILPRKLMIGRAYLRLLPVKSMSYLPGEYKQVQ